MDIWNWISGVISVELTSAEPEIALSFISAMGISLFQMEKLHDLTYSFRILRRDWKRVREICESRGDALRITRRTGLYYWGKSLSLHKALMSGLTLLILIALLLPTRILFVRVEGNDTIPSRRILAAAEAAGIGFGSARREVRSEKVKNKLLSAIPQLQWAGVNTSGCVATISVREQGQEEEADVSPAVSSIVAVRDGYILSATATSGNLLVQPGQTVKSGQILISGYTDCGLSIQASRSTGEIYAQTNREMEAVTPAKWCYRVETGNSHKKISLLFGKKRINLWKGSGNNSPLCGRMYKDYYITLPGGFSLPFGFSFETITEFDSLSMDLDISQCQKSLSEFSGDYLRNHMSAGRILNREEVCTSNKGVYLLRGNYVCSEMIGREQEEQIGEHNG